MTTAVTVNAHAGWPVTVVCQFGEPGQVKEIETQVVDPHTERTFYIHSGMEIIGISEQPYPVMTNGA